MTMQPNLVYVGTYTRFGRSEGIYVYRRDPETGVLTLLHTVSDFDPSFLAFDPGQRFSSPSTSTARPTARMAPSRPTRSICRPAT